MLSTDILLKITFKMFFMNLKAFCLMSVLLFRSSSNGQHLSQFWNYGYSEPVIDTYPPDQQRFHPLFLDYPQNYPEDYELDGKNKLSDYDENSEVPIYDYNQYPTLGRESWRLSYQRKMPPFYQEDENKSFNQRSSISPKKLGEPESEAESERSFLTQSDFKEKLKEQYYLVMHNLNERLGPVMEQLQLLQNSIQKIEQYGKEKPPSRKLKPGQSNTLFSKIDSVHETLPKSTPIPKQDLISPQPMEQSSNFARLREQSPSQIRLKLKPINPIQSQKEQSPSLASPLKLTITTAKPLILLSRSHSRPQTYLDVLPILSPLAKNSTKPII